MVVDINFVGILVDSDIFMLNAGAVVVNFYMCNQFMSQCTVTAKYFVTTLTWGKTNVCSGNIYSRDAFINCKLLE